MSESETDREQIRRALVFHQTIGYGPEDQACACDRKWRTHHAHRLHVAEAVALAIRLPSGADQ